MREVSAKKNTPNRPEIAKEVIEEILEAARFTPSGDNCQPWRFKINENGFTIRYDSQRGAHALNNHHHATYLALGALLEIVSLRASEHGLRCDVELSSDPMDFTKTAKVKLVSADVKKDELSEYIERRSTDRRHYSTEPLLQAQLQELTQINEGIAGCKLKIVDSLSDSFQKYLIKSEKFMWVHKEVLEDLFQWVRLSDQEIKNTSDGMPWQNLGLKWFEVPAFRWLRKHPELPSHLWNLGFSIKINAMVRSSLQNSGGYMGLFVEFSDYHTLVNAGRMAMRAWLLLTKWNLAVQPLSLASLTAFDFNTGHAPAWAKESFYRHYSEAIALFEKEFNMEGRVMPLWLFRFGKVKEVEKGVRTTRRPLAELLD